MSAPKAYSFETFDCFSDFNVCLQVWCCGVLCIPSIATKIGAEDTHDCCNTCKALCATAYWPCGLCCCHEHIMPCYLSRLLDRSMQFHQISVHPAPCGDAKICSCYWQMCLHCTVPCTLCVIFREANLGNQGGQGPVGAAQAYPVK
eukprot:gene8760-10362_t